MSELSPCIIAMEACATSHFWGRLAQGCGHDVRLIPPIYVKPFVKRQKNDAADAAAIAEAALRPNMHYVEVKSAEHQARAVASAHTSALFVSGRNSSTHCVGTLANLGSSWRKDRPTSLRSLAFLLTKRMICLKASAILVGFT